MLLCAPHLPTCLHFYPHPLDAYSPNESREGHNPRYQCGSPPQQRLQCCHSPCHLGASRRMQVHWQTLVVMTSILQRQSELHYDGCGLLCTVSVRNRLGANLGVVCTSLATTSTYLKEERTKFILKDMDICFNCVQNYIQYMTGERHQDALGDSPFTSQH